MNISLSILTLLLVACTYAQQLETGQQVRVINRDSSARYCRTFKTGFESINDFNGFDITPYTSIGSTHGITNSFSRSGSSSHQGQITSIGDKAHTGYPTVEFYKTTDGPIQGPVYITFFVYLTKVDFGSGKWFTLAEVGGDNEAYPGKRYVSVSLDNNYHLSLFNVPNQNGTIAQVFKPDNVFPQNKWVNVTMYIDFDPTYGIAVVWQDGVLVTAANVNGGSGVISQFHAGLFADNLIPSGVIYNDDLTIWQTIRSTDSCPQSGTATAFDLTTIDTTKAPSSGASKIGTSMLIALLAASLFAYLL